MAHKSSASVYRREGDHTLIEVRLREMRQLFHTLDPAPFREKDLDEGAEEYLIEACREVGVRRPALRRALVFSNVLVDPALISEGFLILGWVAMWRPVEVLLYDWWPLARRLALLRCLAAISIEVRAAA